MRSVRVFPDEQALFEAAAEQTTRTLESALAARTRATFVLTGGNTPRQLYGLLASSPYRGRISWERVRFFWGDERCVPPNDPQSNFGMARDTLLSKVPVPPDHIHRMLGELPDADEAARRYEAEISEIIPGPREPAFDLVLLGMGDDGHTASLFPGTQWNEERLVTGNYVPRLGSWRLTMTPRLLNAARAVVFLASGSAKAKALAGVLEGPQGAFPAQRISPARGTLTWMVDAAAARDLKRKYEGT
jgi:6-phosphogluconolactonase